MKRNKNPGVKVINQTNRNCNINRDPETGSGTFKISGGYAGGIIAENVVILAAIATLAY